MSEIEKWLLDLERRMHFINITKCIFDYRFPDEIRKYIPDRNYLDLILVQVLTYMKEATLGNDEKCTLSSIEQYIKNTILPLLPDEMQIDPHTLALFVVRDMLQHGGNLSEYLTYDSEQHAFKKEPIRLVVESNNEYRLTDDALDFLFRSKEIESELDYSVSRFRISEELKRSNYEKALEHSREWLYKMRGVEQGLEAFLQQCRDDFFSVPAQRYTEEIDRIWRYAKSSEEELEILENDIAVREKTLMEARDNEVKSDEMTRNINALKELIENIHRIKAGRLRLLQRVMPASEEYRKMAIENMRIIRYDQVNMDKDVLEILRHCGSNLSEAVWHLFFPMSKPSLSKRYAIERFFEEINEDGNEPEAGVDIGVLEEAKGDANNQIEADKRMTQALTKFLAFARNKTKFKASEFVDSLSVGDLKELSIGKALGVMLLIIRGTEVIDKKLVQRDTDSKPSRIGDYLRDVPQETWFDMQLRTTELQDEFSYTITRQDCKTRVDITDFEVEVFHEA